MKTFEKSELIKAGIRKNFQTGNSKLARRKCYGYNICGKAVLNSVLDRT